MHHRQSNVFFGFLLIGFLAVGLVMFHAALMRKIGRSFLHEKREIVKMLKLTDLCLFTEARYTRHPSMADLSTPFQEHPMALEHFPSGSIMPPPPHLQANLQK